MKKSLKISAVIALVVLVGIQFVPTKRNQNVEIVDINFVELYQVPENVSSILKKSCYDCHSNYTEYPWYNKIQPVSWLLENHIREAKEELNFSEFGNYSSRRTKNKLKSINSQIKKNEMPLEQYLWMHTDAKLSESQKKEVIDFIDSLVYK